jgi:electron transfer flavoprotein alpha subunit
VRSVFLPSVVAVTLHLNTAEDVAELLTLARACGDVNWANMGPLPDGASDVAAKFGVSSVVRLSDARLDAKGADAAVEALMQYCVGSKPGLVLFNQDFDSRLVAPRLAGRLGVPVVMNALAVETAGDDTIVTASAYGGDTHAVYRLTGPGPHVVGVMPNAIAAEPSSAPSTPAVEDFSVDLSGLHERVRVVTPAEAEGARLEDAQVIVAGGRGLGSPSNFNLIEDLAAAVGGMPAASRPLVDDGWTDASRQVGLTGRITRPALYMALGISGASQHMAGCSAAKTIVAVNRDPDAAIFRYAKYGIVGDCLEIIPELIAAVREA